MRWFVLLLIQAGPSFFEFRLITFVRVCHFNHLHFHFDYIIYSSVGVTTLLYHLSVAGGIALRLVVYYKAKNAKKFRQGVEYGSAGWGNAKDIEPYMDSVFENNVLLTQTERLMMSGRPKEPKYARNKNILVIGGSGSGKTRFFVKPNLMQMHSSYVVTDPKGTVLVECGKMLRRASTR